MNFSPQINPEWPPHFSLRTPNETRVWFVHLLDHLRKKISTPIHRPNRSFSHPRTWTAADMYWICSLNIDIESHSLAWDWWIVPFFAWKIIRRVWLGDSDILDTDRSWVLGKKAVSFYCFKLPSITVKQNACHFLSLCCPISLMEWISCLCAHNIAVFWCCRYQSSAFFFFLMVVLVLRNWWIVGCILCIITRYSCLFSLVSTGTTNTKGFLLFFFVTEMLAVAVRFMLFMDVWYLISKTIKLIFHLRCTNEISLKRILTVKTTTVQKHTLNPTNKTIKTSVSPWRNVHLKIYKQKVKYFRKKVVSPVNQ